MNRLREEQAVKGKIITYGDLVEQYIFLDSRENKSPKIASARYINFLSDFLKNETGRNRSEALAAWEELKATPEEKNYTAWKKHSEKKVVKKQSEQ